MQMQMRAFPHAFIVWKPRGTGRCSAQCGRRNKAAYNRGVQERIHRGWVNPNTHVITSTARQVAAMVNEHGRTAVAS
jgi:hypothetical protein